MVSTRIFLPALLVVLLICIGAAQGLKCFKCGQYNDGVGSITPCINQTVYMHQVECPANSQWCIKYVSEGSTVRDCVGSCTENEAWSTRTYCCQEDGCNSGPEMPGASSTLCAIATAILILLERGLRG